jgi:hypothetical protein
MLQDKKDSRKSRRRPMRYTAWVLLTAKEKYGCVLSDISEAGARIDVEDGNKIPDHFFLLLSGNGKARRACEVIWRKPTQIGVKFERRMAPVETAALLPKFATDAQPAEPAAVPADSD